MILPPVLQSYQPSHENVRNTELRNADFQNLKLDQDNFLDSGSLCLQSDDGSWFKLVVSDAGILSATTVTVDSDGLPRSTGNNPYYAP